MLKEKHMNALAIIFSMIGLRVIPAGYIIYRQVISIKKTNRQAFQKQLGREHLLISWLKSGQLKNRPDIYSYAKNTLTRESTFLLLQHNDLVHLFPDEFYTIEKAAESNLANWLDFPTELGTGPDEMNYLKKVTIGLDEYPCSLDYYVYSFKMHDTHWAAGNGWMLGVVGPYSQDSKPYDHPGATFSRFNNNSDKEAPDEEAKWVHENIFLLAMNGAKQKIKFA